MHASIQGESVRGAQVSTGSQHDEFERVLRSMRERLDAVSAAIADGITKANWQAEKAPVSMRVSARAAAAEIAYTQEWLHERLRLLPFDPKQRYQVMNDLLQSQFVALQKVTSIVEDLMTLHDRPASAEYMPPGTRRQPQILPPVGPSRVQEPPFGRDFGPQDTHPPGDMRGYRQLAPPPGQYYPSPQQPAPLHLADLDPGAVTQRTRTQTRPMKTAPRQRAKEDRGEEDSEGGLLSIVTRRLAMRTAGLAVAVVMVLGTGYYAYARLWSPAAKTAAGKHERVSVGDPNARGKAGTGIQPPPVRSLDPSPNRVPSAPPMSAPPLAERSGPLPGMVVADPARPPVKSGDEPQFVAVIATHRDRQALAAIYNDLRRQFPTVMGQRKADAQAVNLGEKGVWHHLVLLPLGTRQQATVACEELRSVGYTRCFVRPY